VAEEISVLHVIPGLDPRSGGTSRAVVDMTDALAQQPGLLVTLMYTEHVDGECLSSDPKVRRIGVSAESGLRSKAGLAFQRELERRIDLQRPALIHVHGLWHPVDHWAASSARRHRIPLVIQPHGMLEAWALRHRSLRKRAAMWLYQRRDLQAAKLLIASTAREMQSFRALGLQCPVAVIPHGVRTPPDAKTFDGERRNSPDGARTVLFLSRLHPVKGLPALLNVWARLRPAGWRLVIAGPDEGGHLREVQAQIGQLGIGESVRYVGEVRDEVKSALFRSADLFVLPTHSENFGIVIAEAMAHGLPVITTKGAPWKEIEAHDCGWRIDIGEEPLVKAMREAMSMSDEVRGEMGLRGRQLAQRYEWMGIARQLHAAYRWLLGNGERPDCVSTD
jgi:glycosyltransferase involved in cell wall biosynthesis